MYLPNKQLVFGTLERCNLSYNIAVVSVKGFRCLRTAELHNQVQIEPLKEVVAVGRIFESGKLMATSGTLTASGPKDCGHLMFSTCKLSEVHLRYYECYNLFFYYML